MSIVSTIFVKAQRFLPLLGEQVSHEKRKEVEKIDSDPLSARNDEALCIKRPLAQLLMMLLATAT